MLIALIWLHPIFSDTNLLLVFFFPSGRRYTVSWVTVLFLYCFTFNFLYYLINILKLWTSSIFFCSLGEEGKERVVRWVWRRKNGKTMLSVCGQMQWSDKDRVQSKESGESIRTVVSGHSDNEHPHISFYSPMLWISVYYNYLFSLKCSIIMIL